MQHGQRQPGSLIVAAVITDDPKQGQQIPFAHCDWNRHLDPSLAASDAFTLDAGVIGRPYAERLIAASGVSTPTLVIARTSTPEGVRHDPSSPQWHGPGRHSRDPADPW